MAFSLADTYYLKAMDAYPYSLEESIENLNYALSYNAEHANAICLMARILSEHFMDYDHAEEYFERALAANPNHFESCIYYTQQLIKTSGFDKAGKLLKYAYTLKGADLARVYYLDGLMHEYQKDYEAAGQLYNEALENAFNIEFIHIIEECKERLTKKIDLRSSIIYSVC